MRVVKPVNYFNQQLDKDDFLYETEVNEIVFLHEKMELEFLTFPAPLNVKMEPVSEEDDDGTDSDVDRDHDISESERSIVNSLHEPLRVREIYPEAMDGMETENEGDNATDKNDIPSILDGISAAEENLISIPSTSNVYDVRIANNDNADDILSGKLRFEVNERINKNKLVIEIFNFQELSK